MSVIKQCITCGKGYSRKPSHADKSSYCSKGCMSVGYQERLTGSNNPNYKDAGKRICTYCGDTYKSYNKSRKFCSSRCYNRSRIVHKQINKHVPPLQLVSPCPYCGKGNMTGNHRTCGSDECKLQHSERRNYYTKKKNKRHCEQCSKVFYSPKSETKRYCSYECSIKSGSSMRAGMAAHRARQTYGATKKDFNHNELTAWFEDCGCSVIDLSAVGGGVPDAIIGFRGENHFVEYKNPKTAYGRNGLNRNQKIFAEWWTGADVYIVRTQSDVIDFVNGDRSKLIAL